jgi:hypothetical protein
MTNQEISNRIAELSNLLNTTPASDPKWDVYYTEYIGLSAIRQRRYRDEQEPKINDYYNRYIRNKSWEEAEPYWDFYSDWHKDCYGYRPRWVEDMAVGDK